MIKIQTIHTRLCKFTCFFSGISERE